MRGKKRSSTSRTDDETNVDVQGLSDATASAVASGGGPTASEELHLQQGVESAEKEAENQEMEEDDEDDEEDENGGAEDEEEKPKLAEGFYEIESVRRKRVRKGQVQYFVKWRGWPETANTWEPVENLVAVSDVIEQFEESLRSGGKSRRRKRKHGGSSSKKKPQKRTVTEEPHEEEEEEIEPVTFPVEEDHQNGGDEEPEKDVTENEEEGAVSSPGNVRLTNLRVTRGSNGNGKKADVAGPVIEASESGPQNGSEIRSTGAKRRKSGSVKRFKLDRNEQSPALINLSGPGPAQAPPGPGPSQPPPPLPVAAPPPPPPTQATEGVNHDSARVIEIIKPISYSSELTNNVQDVRVTFMVKRADGKEVMVDNKFLKTNYPLLLITFYEAHLRYSPT